MDDIARPADPAPPGFAGGALPARGIQAGTPAFRRTILAQFAGGFATFALLYCVQPLMPLFATEFGVGAAGSSLSLSLSTGLMAVCLLVAGSLSEAWGRKGLMTVSLAVSAVLGIAAALVPGWTALLLVRALEGIALSGLPAVAMAYLSEEMAPEAIGLAMGLSIGGNAVGGLAGRLVTGVLADFGDWRLALGAIGGMGLICAGVFWRGLPPSRNFRPRPLVLRHLVLSLLAQFRDPGLRWLFAEGFLLMGAFVTVYNYLGFRLMAPPFNLSQTVVGLVFALYLIGIFASAWVGDLAGRLGRRRVLWATFALMLAGIALTWPDNLPTVIAGVAVLTFGFFGAHSIASSWVGRRARQAKAQASSLYLFFYYLGSSVVGSLGGFAWSAGHWGGVSALVGALLVVALAISLRLAALAPLGAG